MRLRYTVSMFRSCDLLLLSLSALSFLTGCSETLTDGTTVLSNEPVSFRVDAIDGTPVSNASAPAKGSRASADATSPMARTPDPQSYRRSDEDHGQRTYTLSPSSRLRQGGRRGGCQGHRRADHTRHPHRVAQPTHTVRRFRHPIRQRQCLCLGHAQQPLLQRDGDKRELRMENC